MDPENPSRRSKPDQEPLTIDLEANAAAADKPAIADGEETVSNEGAHGTQAVHETADDPGGALADDAQATNPDSIDIVDPEIAERNTAADEDARAEAAAMAFTEEPPSAAREQAAHTASRPQDHGASRSSALAAGIVGGLIALLATGGLQYAGVLPAFGPDRGSSAIEQGLAADVESLKAQLAAAPSATADFGPLETRITELEKKSAEAATVPAADVSGLEAQLASLTNEIATLKSNIADAQASTDAAKSELSTRIEAAEKKIEEPASDVQLARAIAVTALKTAIDRGGPFLAELDALKSVSAEDTAVTGLADDATTGVAPRADLVRDFPSTADAMIEATQHSDPEQGIFSRLVDSASSAIRVRPVGSIEGDTPEAIIARIEDKLTNGDLKGASLEWETLPDPAKAAGAAFKSKLDQRVRVEGLIDATVSGAMTAKG
ncbi:COG4223 family protein [Pararhizobium gei]|uniref:COG4223 family protein n=1 Tax=Pararhizobium gei TaxID=1395951 RepID=UPI0023DB34FD|nr:hypothetical protein [Rhizobium gei]